MGSWFGRRCPSRARAHPLASASALAQANPIPLPPPLTSTTSAGPTGSGPSPSRAMTVLPRGSPAPKSSSGCSSLRLPRNPATASDPQTTASRSRRATASRAAETRDWAAPGRRGSSITIRLTGMSVSFGPSVSQSEPAPVRPSRGSVRGHGGAVPAGVRILGETPHPVRDPRHGPRPAGGLGCVRRRQPRDDPRHQSHHDSRDAAAQPLATACPLAARPRALGGRARAGDEDAVAPDVDGSGRVVAVEVGEVLDRGVRPESGDGLRGRRVRYRAVGEHVPCRGLLAGKEQRDPPLHVLPR